MQGWKDSRRAAKETPPASMTVRTAEETINIKPVQIHSDTVSKSVYTVYISSYSSPLYFKIKSV